MTHVHTWTADRSASRYRCACGVAGHKPALMAGQHRTSADGVVPYLCQREIAGRKHCGAEAVHVTGDRSANRCAAHAPAHHNGTNHSTSGERNESNGAAI